jgi:hypothetical protein
MLVKNLLKRLIRSKISDEDFETNNISPKYDNTKAK